jgi:hypothetical protein
MDITIGAKEAYLDGNGMMNSLQNGLKMLLKTTGACTGVPVSMQNSKIKACIVGEKELFV